jgi:hypothetical protein
MGKFEQDMCIEIADSIPAEVYTVARYPDGSTMVAHLPSVYESSSPLAVALRERRNMQTSAELEARQDAMRRLYRGLMSLS